MRSRGSSSVNSSPSKLKQTKITDYHKYSKIMPVEKPRIKSSKTAVGIRKCVITISSDSDSDFDQASLERMSPRKKTKLSLSPSNGDKKARKTGQGREKKAESPDITTISSSNYESDTQQPVQEEFEISMTNETPTLTIFDNERFTENETESVKQQFVEGESEISEKNEPLTQNYVPLEVEDEVKSNLELVKQPSVEEDFDKSALHETQAISENQESVVEEGEINFFKYLTKFKEVLKKTLNDDQRRNLLHQYDIEIVQSFLKMDLYPQYFLLKLLTYLPKWYNFEKFTKSIHLDQRLIDLEIDKITDELVEEKFLDTDVEKLDLDTVLNMLEQNNLLEICKKTFRIGKLKSVRKDDLINLLKKRLRTQRTLGPKPPEEILKNAVCKYLKNYFCLKNEARESLFKTYLTQVFASIPCWDLQTYIYKTSVSPHSNRHNFCPFESREAYHCYFKAILLKRDLYRALEHTKNIRDIEICANSAFEQLRNLPNEGKIATHLPRHLQPFSAEYLLISILTKSSSKLTTIHFNSVREWLEFLLENYKYHSARGFWYKQIAHIFSQYLKNYEMASLWIINALKEYKEKQKFNIVQLHELSFLGRKLRNTGTYNVSASYKEKLELLCEPHIELDEVPVKTITAITDRNMNGNGRRSRRTYSFLDENNEENFGTVEMVALNHYEKSENFKGIHCEGRIISLLFLLIFYDLIYGELVKDVFVSLEQDTPIDFYSESFYVNRKSNIDAKLCDIENNEPSILETVKSNWKKSIQFETFTKNFMDNKYEEFIEILECVDGRILAKIMRRLISNYKVFRSGLPDLFLWNSEMKKCKFVEIKGENDKLSLKQTLWLKCLVGYGANVEICHVTGVGCRMVSNSNQSD